MYTNKDHNIVNLKNIDNIRISPDGLGISFWCKDINVSEYRYNDRVEVLKAITSLENTLINYGGITLL